MGSPGQDIIHLLVARVVYGQWALAYKLIRMPGSIENVANHAIYGGSEALAVSTNFCRFFIRPLQIA